MRLIIIVFFISLNTSQIFGQQILLDKRINIDGTKTTMFSKDEFNLVAITSTSDSIQKLVFKSSQGKLENLDSGITSGLFYLSDLEIGKVTISVFKQVDTGLRLMNYKIYNVIKKPLTADQRKIAQLKIKPILSLEGYVSGKVPLEVVKKATKFKINAPYKLKQLTAYFGSRNQSDMVVMPLKLEVFDNNFLNVWKRIYNGSTITLDNIEVIDNKGIIYRLNPVGFLITE